MTTLREDPAKGVRLTRDGNTYYVQTYRPATGILLSTRKFESTPKSARRYYSRALSAAQAAKHLDNSNLNRPPLRYKRS